MAAPDLRLRTPNGTGANSSTQSANGSRASRRGKTKSFLRRKDEGETEVPPAGRQRSLWTRSRKKDVDTGWPSHGSRDRERAVVSTYLITFTCYGNRLHGDNGGSVDRNHNVPGRPYLEPDENRASVERAAMNQPSYLLDSPRRKLTLEALVEVCSRRSWSLMA